MKKRLSLMLLCCLLAGCTHANRPLNPLNLALEDRAKNHTRARLGADITLWPPPGTQPSITPATGPAQTQRHDRDGYFVGLAISGGGSRSSVFAAACMFELQKLGILQRVDYISTVSGGSLAGAFYCLGDSDWNPANVQKKLAHSFASDMLTQMIQPWIALALFTTDLDRSDLLADSLRRNLFTRNGRELTFSDLRRDRPHLLINATDLQSGRAFVFCDESFDELNSDLGKFPLAYACAASSAVPVAMHQVTLRDYSTIFKQYKHLIDGGVTDNLGITTLVEVYDAHMKSAEHADQTDPYRNGAIFIVLDAHTHFDAQIAEKPDTGILESLQAGVGLSSTALVNRASSATLADTIVRYSPNQTTARQIRDQIDLLSQSGMLDLKDQRERSVRIVHVALSRLSDLRNVPSYGFSDRVNSIATYFDIDPTEAYNLNKAAELLVREMFQSRLEQIARELSAE